MEHSGNSARSNVSQTKSNGTRPIAIWLEENNLEVYLEGLQQEGYDDLEVLTALTDEELEDLATALNMKKGHRWVEKQ